MRRLEERGYRASLSYQHAIRGGIELAMDKAEISQSAGHNPQNSHQWLDANGWDERRSYVLAEDGIIYPVDLYIAKAKDGRNILYDANVKIKEGISIDKIATSLRSRKNARQAVKVPKPSNKGFAMQPKSEWHEKAIKWFVEVMNK